MNVYITSRSPKAPEFLCPRLRFPHQEAEDLKEISFKSSIREQKLMDMKHLEVLDAIWGGRKWDEMGVFFHQQSEWDIIHDLTMKKWELIQHTWCD